MEPLREYLVIWIASNAVAIVFLIAALLRTKLARLFFVLLFSWACWLNYTTAHTTPEDYLNYAEFTPFELYYNFINGWFADHITSMVTAIAIGQGLIAIGMVLKGWILRIACYGAILFFLAIIALGVGSGFPTTLIMGVAVYFILKKDDLNYLWKFRNKTSKADQNIVT